MRPAGSDCLIFLLQRRRPADNNFHRLFSFSPVTQPAWRADGRPFLPRSCQTTQLVPVKSPSPPPTALSFPSLPRRSTTTSSERFTSATTSQTGDLARSIHLEDTSAACRRYLIPPGTAVFESGSSPLASRSDDIFSTPSDLNPASIFSFEPP
ncbi:hypothetical protein BGZ61DRAFT_440652 [Ilyonectria robusta]|uniref:uncharacterized protein n=1 Tax=Ilyonectria robusta TaxID=1079257 RepID=UPI001E8D738E|nr:uncharacterized protein BGZ61DRAFT_440652 [Ilyonectria robusta]KAH8735655.1 hypothetical protein BGZ61DRAFT_440652 [Ilyonectria robusta]